MSASAAKATETRTILPPIPAKRYFTIGEVSELCDTDMRKVLRP